MIINTGSPISPKVYFKINGVEVNYFSINKIVLELDVNKHDVLTFTMNGIPPRAITDYIGAAVDVSVGSGFGRRQSFCGYVMYVEPEYDSAAPVVNSSVFHTAKIVCFGASLTMKGAKQRIWKNTTIYKVANELADTYGFSLECIKDDYVIPRIVQATESDWEFLVRICETYGYSVTVHGTHMAIWDPFKAIGHRRSYEKLIPASSYSGPKPGSITSMHGTFGQLTPDGESYKYQITSIDANGAVVTTVDNYTNPSSSFSGKATEPTYISKVAESAVSVAEAEKFIGAIKRKNFPFNAHVRVSAGAGNVPGGVVELAGYNSNFEGMWYIKSVKHTIVSGDYFTDMSISKDYNTSNEYLVPPTSLPQLQPDPMFVNNQWKSSLKKVTLYV